MFTSPRGKKHLSDGTGKDASYFIIITEATTYSSYGENTRFIIRKSGLIFHVAFDGRNVQTCR